MSLPMADIAIIGAGPYGLSIAAHLRKTRLRYRIFGTPMQSWRQQMPKGMLLKSDGFASSLYDPDSSFTLGHYCAEAGLPYADVGLPVPCETFVSYGMEFQKRFVPTLEETNVRSVKYRSGVFELLTDKGEMVTAAKVVVAAGITHFGYLPPVLAGLTSEFVSHSLQHNDLSRFKGHRVGVIGAGASAVDIAALLNEAGAEVHLVARRSMIAFHELSKEPRPFLERLMAPRSALGLGWKSRLCTDAPLIFHAMPQRVRFRAVQRHLGPAPGWFMREKVVDRFPMHLGARIEGASVQNGHVRLRFTEGEGRSTDLQLDHIIGATGFRVAISRLKFLDEDLRNEIRVVEETPVLSRSFETSVPGLYMVGIASANSFGPLTRFAYGAKFTAKHFFRHITASISVL
jgi:cation diffusion facilitator CzcD-associated flavoprotein CzcO